MAAHSPQIHAPLQSATTTTPHSGLQSMAPLTSGAAVTPEEHCAGLASVAALRAARRQQQAPQVRRPPGPPQGPFGPSGSADLLRSAATVSAMEEGLMAPALPSKDMQPPSDGSFKGYDVESLRANLNITNAEHAGGAGLVEFVSPKKVGTRSGDALLEAFVSPNTVV